MDRFAITASPRGLAGQPITNDGRREALIFLDGIVETGCTKADAVRFSSRR
jgi:hypothetical protein